MIRWKYVIPRLLALTLITTAIYVGTEPLLRWLFLRSAQQVARARVEIGSLTADFWRGSIQIEDVAAADSNVEFKNLLQFDRARLDIDRYAAMRRKLVVRDGLIEGLRFNTQRGDSGFLPDTSESSKSDGPSLIRSKLNQVGQQGEAWFNHKIDRLQTQVENDLQTVRLGRELADRWPVAYQSLERQAAKIEAQGRQLNQQIEAVSEDPLQRLDQVQPLKKSVDRLRRDVVAARDQLTQLKQQMREDRRALASAKKQDEQYVRDRLRLDSLDGDSLTEYLLGPTWSKRMEMATRWLQRSRDAVPADVSSSVVQPASRGVSVIFPGFSASPDSLIRQLKLAGEGAIDGTPFLFSGTVRDITHQPRRHAKPTTVKMESDGALRLIAYGTLDRRQPEPVDHFVVDIPSLRQGKRLLGDPSKFALAVSPSVAKIHVDLTFRADRLEGRVTMRQDEVRLAPALGPQYSSILSPENIASAVRDVDRLEVEVYLSGTIKAPRYRVKSDLGLQLADGFNQALEREVQRRQQVLLSRANREAEQKLGELQNELATKHGVILKRLEVGDEQIDALKRILLSQASGAEDLMSRGRKLLFK